MTFSAGKWRAKRLLPPLAALALAALSAFLVHDHTRGDSLSADEPIHLLSGFLMVESRDAIVNIEHPPLMKVLSGLSISRLGLTPPERIPMGTAFWDWGHPFLFANRVPVDTIVAAARLPFAILLALLVGVVFAIGRSRWGSGPALFAAALCAFDPNLVAHAGVVHTDLGAALMFLLAVVASDAAVRSASPARVALAGAALGAAFVTKFSSVYLVPILLLQALLPSLPGRAARPTARTTLRTLAVILVVAGVVVFGVYALVTGRMDRVAQRGVIHELVAGRGAPGLSRVVEKIAEVSPPAGHYLGGLASVVRQNAEGGGVNFLFGKVSITGFPLYFFVAFLAKSSLAFLIVTAMCLVSLFRDPETRREAPLFLLPVGVLFLASIGTTYNIGIRHMLPVYPFLALSGAGVLGRALARSPYSKRIWILAALPVVSAVELARIHPHELSYFNPFVGGPSSGSRILSDSNVDWGLDLKRLGEELRRRGLSNPTVAYFGGDDVPYRVGVPDFTTEPVVRGRLVAVSAVYLAEGPEFFLYHQAPRTAAVLKRLFDELAARGRPAGRVGWSISLFELPGSPDHQ